MPNNINCIIFLETVTGYLLRIRYLVAQRKRIIIVKNHNFLFKSLFSWIEKSIFSIKNKIFFLPKMSPNPFSPQLNAYVRGLMGFYCLPNVSYSCNYAEIRKHSIACKIDHTARDFYCLWTLKRYVPFPTPKFKMWSCTQIRSKLFQQF